jgi:flagellar hook-associated protein 3 FlgL
MQARTGNGVFEARAVTSTGTAWIDAGSVTNPAAITGSTYSVTFGVSGGATTYSVLKDGAPTAQTNVAFTPGQAIQVDGMSATVSGQPANGDVFQLAPSTPTLSVFGALDKAIADLKTPGRTGTQIAQSNVTSLASLDAVLGQVLAGRSQVGATMNRIDAVTGRLSALKLASQTERSNAENLDMTQAISAFSNQQTGYDAALKAYAMVQRLSLFNYLTP